MIYKNYTKICLIVLIMSILPLFFIKKAYASDDDTPDIEITEDGEIIIKITAKAASTNIRYRSIGFTITTQPSRKTATAKGITGPAAPAGPYKRIYLKNKEVKINEKYRDTQKVVTEYYCSKEYVKEIMKSIIDLDRISNDTVLYFNVIFQTYKIINGKEVILTPEITTWKDIVNNQPWGNINVFERYFNIKVTFNPGIQDNQLHYLANGKEIALRDLDSLTIDQNLTWDSIVKPTIEYKNRRYNLTGYYVRAKLDDKKAPDRVRKMVGDKVKGKTITAEDIINDSVKVLYGGMDVYMIYEKKDVPLRIHAAVMDTNEIIREDLYVGSAEPGKEFKKEIDRIITVNGYTYNKTKYFYCYLKNNPARMKFGETKNDDDPIEFTAFDNINSDDEIIVIAYYKKLSSGIIPVKINAVCKDNGQLIKTITTDTVKSGETYKYTVNEILTEGDKSYNYTGEWSWQYKKNTASAPVVKSSGKGVNISFKAPSFDEISGEITINIYYRTEDSTSDEIKLRVIMVRGKWAFIEEISKETVTLGQKIKKPIEKVRRAGNITYQYQDKWDYTYRTESGEKIKTGSGTTASFTVPSDTLPGSVITLRLYYDAAQSEYVPEALPPIVLPLDSPSPYAVINGDEYDSPHFISKEGISTTESQHVYVKTKDYLLGYRLVNKTGKITLTIPVTMTYTLKYYTATPPEYGGPKEVTDTVTDIQYISVERAYSYWEIDSLEYYIPNSANVYNYSLPDGKVNLSINSKYLNVPSLYTIHSSNIYDHIILPKQVTEGIHLTYDTPIVSEESYRPNIEFIDLTSYALEMTEELKVKNDYIMFDGTVVMSDAIAEKIAPTPNVGVMIHTSSLTHDKALFRDGLVIDALKKNGVYQSDGNVIYKKHPMSVNAYNSGKAFDMSVNNVIIHTPVICDPIINSDNDKWVQLIEPEENAYQIVLDPDTGLNDFTVRISNKLPHSNRLGYYERDFSRSYRDPENVSYIAKKDGKLRNEMKLPFDVYIDIKNDNDPKNDELIRAGTWIILDRKTYRFYVPMWVKEGVYTARFRTIAVNGEDMLDNTEDTRNSDINNYVATASRTFQISGRIYGLTLYDISDESRWKNVFRKKDTMMFKLFEGATDGTKKTDYNDDYAYYYTVGTKNQYGLETGRYNKYTLPLINGSHPKYKNLGVLKTGYAFRFMIDTTGEMYGSGCKIRIIPTFYHVDEEGKNRQRVDIYYDEEINGKQQYLVKIGEGIDLANVKQGQVGNPYTRIPEDELKHTAKVMDTTYAKLSYQYGVMYTYGDIRISSLFRTFIGKDYARQISNHPSFEKVKEYTGETELSLSKYMQRWYGTYKLPTNIHVAPAGYDVYGYLKKHGIDYSEDFWIKDGYIIVNFNIETIDKNGERHLSYINGLNYLNRGHCSMWVTEGAIIQKKDNRGTVFNFKAGDVILYYVNKKYSDDFMGVLY